MLRLNRLAFLLMACCCHLYSTAQTPACSAGFSYLAQGYNTVELISADSLNATQHWNFGDGTPAVSTTNGIIFHQFAKPGQYEVMHFIERQNSTCHDSLAELIFVGDTAQCQASFSYQKISGTASYQFSNNTIAAAGIRESLWDFGDGTTSQDKNPVHNYLTPGTYTVCLFISGNNGCTSSYCSGLAITDSLSGCNIATQFQYRHDSIDCKKVYFSNLSTMSSNIHFTWNFGDGNTSGDANPIHSYLQPGKYYVCLVSQSDSNCHKEYCDSVIINCSSCNLTAKFTTRHDSIQQNTIYFTNLSNPAGDIKTTYWSFGDGDSSHDNNAVHTYNKPGIYNVCLKVVGISGCTSNYCDTILAGKTDGWDSCAINAKFNQYSTPGSLNVKFEALYQDSATSYHWNFGDSTAGVGRIAYHTYSKPGQYNICLTVKNSQCSATWCNVIILERAANDSGRVILFPNPAINNISVNVLLKNAGKISLRLLDGKGTKKAEYNYSGFAGGNKFIIPVEKLNPGIYTIEVRTNEGVTFNRFVKG